MRNYEIRKNKVPIKGDVLQHPRESFNYEGENMLEIAYCRPPISWQGASIGTWKFNTARDLWDEEVKKYIRREVLDGGEKRWLGVPRPFVGLT